MPPKKMVTLGAYQVPSLRDTKLYNKSPIFRIDRRRVRLTEHIRYFFRPCLLPRPVNVAVSMHMPGNSVQDSAPCFSGNSVTRWARRRGGHREETAQPRTLRHPALGARFPPVASVIGHHLAFRARSCNAFFCAEELLPANLERRRLANGKAGLPASVVAVHVHQPPTAVWELRTGELSTARR